MTPPYENIYVLYPKGVRTGGPEALHQLVDMLRKLGQSAFLVPCSGEDKERVSDYENYDAPEAPHAIDSPLNAVVAPETYANKLNTFRLATKYCWWLSIDNSPLFESERLLGRLVPDGPRSIMRILKHSTLSSVRHSFQLGNRKDWRHLTQSSYAWAFISSRFDTNPSLLSDYTRLDEFADVPLGLGSRGRSVAYNPAKGREMLEGVIAAAPKDIEWRPIQGYSRSEVIQLLQSTSVYLDMGHHPGKDRMPREAALAGALSLVVRRGAGAYYSDIPIPWEHKILLGRDAVTTAVDRIETVLKEVPAELEKQAVYVRRIRGEKVQFQREVADIFLEGRLGKDYPEYEAEGHFQ